VEAQVSAAAAGVASLFLDTNVWVDYFLDRGIRHGLAGRLVAVADQREVSLYTSLTSLKDTYYIVAAELKHIARDEGRLDAGNAGAINQIAWSCVHSMLEYSTVIPAGTGDVWEASMLRTVHADFEDNLLLAVAKKCRADVLVTEDAALRAHAPLRTASIEEAIALLEPPAPSA
jgi:predicted nucleic acid-binding protein